MLASEVLTYTDGHRPVCECGYVGRMYPLGQYDTARAALIAHQTANHYQKESPE